MKLQNIIEFKDFLLHWTENANCFEYSFNEKEILERVRYKFLSLGLNDDKIDVEPIDDDKLDELSDNYYFNEEMESSGEFERIKNAYEAGYRKAKE